MIGKIRFEIRGAESVHEARERRVCARASDTGCVFQVQYTAARGPRRDRGRPWARLQRSGPRARPASGVQRLTRRHPQARPGPASEQARPSRDQSVSLPSGALVTRDKRKREPKGAASGEGEGLDLPFRVQKRHERFCCSHGTQRHSRCVVFYKSVLLQQVTTTHRPSVYTLPRVYISSHPSVRAC